MNPNIITGNNVGLVTRFQRGVSGSPNGRPPKLLRQLQNLVSDDGAQLTREDVSKVILRMLDSPVTEVQEFCNDTPDDTGLPRIYPT